MSVRIVGLNAFVKNVSRKSSQVQEAVGQEISRSALRVERKAKMISPWDTGWMSNNIYSVMTAKARAEVISPAEYSIWQEYGTRYQPAQPFMFPALKEEYPLLIRNLNKLMKG